MTASLAPNLRRLLDQLQIRVGPCATELNDRADLAAKEWSEVEALLLQRAQAIAELELKLFHCEKDRDAARSDRNRFQTMTTCQTHGDPLVCLACEAEEDARPEWAAGVDVEAMRQLARTHRVPRDPFAEQLSEAIFRLCDQLTARAQAIAQGQAERDAFRELSKEASEIMTITYAGNFPAGIESFLIRASRAEAAIVSSVPRPRAICLCGSTRFIEQFAILTWLLERQGSVVLGCTLLPMWFCGVPSHFGEATGTKAQCDDLHLRKIDMADEVLVINVGGYIGESTRNEIAYATATGKPVRYLTDEPDLLQQVLQPADAARVARAPQPEQEHLCESRSPDGDGPAVGHIVRQRCTAPEGTQVPGAGSEPADSQTLAAPRPASAALPDVREVYARMWEFATTKPSPQQTRQKSAREMVELFAQELAAALARAEQP